MRHLFLALGFLLIVLVLFSGCITTPPQGSGVHRTLQPGKTRSDLKIGDAVIFEFKGFKKTVRVTGFNETSHMVIIETKNTGDKAISTISRMWIVDGNGVHYDLPEFQDDSLSPNESRSRLVNLYQFHGIQDSTTKGKVILYYTFGNQEASWIINEK
jgi:hypothetical protein